MLVGKLLFLVLACTLFLEKKQSNWGITLGMYSLMVKQRGTTSKQWEQDVGSTPTAFLSHNGAWLVLITDYLVREHAKTDGKTSKQ